MPHKNRKKSLAYQRAYSKRRYHSDPEYRKRQVLRTRARYRADPELGRQAVLRRHAAYRAFIDPIKLKRGCEAIKPNGKRCGFREHPHALDFDHCRGRKLFEISRGWGRSRAAVLREIAKCEVICSNHHRIRTCERRCASSRSRRGKRSAARRAAR